MMLDKLFSLFGENPIHRIAMITAMGSQIVKTFEQEFAADHNAKDAGIDTLIEILQKHKQAMKNDA